MTVIHLHVTSNDMVHELQMQNFKAQLDAMDSDDDDEQNIRLLNQIPEKSTHLRQRVITSMIHLPDL
jgi:heme/copper-type cytochrome/quinol oxidase subunit 2